MSGWRSRVDRVWIVVSVLPCVLAGGCLAVPDTPPVVRTFGITREAWPRLGEGRDPSGLPAVVLDELAPAVHLDERMVWRVGPTEWMHDGDAHWLAPPERLVTDALRAAVHGRAGYPFAPGVAGGAETLRLRGELRAFERDAEAVVVVVLLHLDGADSTVLRERVPVEDVTPEAYAAAMQRAVEGAGRQLVEWLDSRASGSTP